MPRNDKRESNEHLMDLPGPQVNPSDPPSSTIFQMCGDRDGLFPTLKKTRGSGFGAPVCRVDVNIGDRLIDACIDSGATFTMMSSRVYDNCQEHVGPIEPTTVKLSGAGGNDIGLRRVSRVVFW